MKQEVIHYLEIKYLQDFFPVFLWISVQLLFIFSFSSSTFIGLRCSSLTPDFSHLLPCLSPNFSSVFKLSGFLLSLHDSAPVPMLCCSATLFVFSPCPPFQCFAVH
ncbi:hypothetical protein GOODEAATRI_007172 [Goodea atripinnis]|uniref:Uncharacterized protein n=1 Tax=Goodea atripinnis TaxID=208336 RepID=A0ABV0MFS7_9TELE